MYYLLLNDERRIIESNLDIVFSDGRSLQSMIAANTIGFRSNLPRRFESYTTSSSNPDSLLVIGEVSLSEPNEPSIIDVRIEGGNLINEYEASQLVNPSVPGNLVAYIEYPLELVGKEEEIKRAVKEFGPVGLYPVLASYSTPIVISDYQLDSTSITPTLVLPSGVSSAEFLNEFNEQLDLDDLEPNTIYQINPVVPTEPITGLYDGTKYHSNYRIDIKTLRS